MAFYWHLLVLTPLTFFHLWLYRPAVVVKDLSHDLQWTDFSSRCLLWWTCKLNFNEKDFSHWSQANAFSPVCVNWWTLSECLVVRYLGHLSQGNNFSVPSSITLVSYIGSFTTWQRIMWSFKDGKTLKDLSHWLQGNGLSSEWIFLCKIRFVDVVKDFPQSSQGCGFSPEWLLLWSLM